MDITLFLIYLTATDWMMNRVELEGFFIKQYTQSWVKMHNFTSNNCGAFFSVDNYFGAFYLSQKTEFKNFTLFL